VIIFQCILYSKICGISSFDFGADFPFNIGLYDNFHYLWVTMQLVMDILLNKFRFVCNGYTTFFNFNFCFFFYHSVFHMF
jgi:hypothetical protein